MTNTAHRALDGLCRDGDGVDFDRIRDLDADVYAGQELGLTSAMRKKSTNKNSCPSDIASNPPDAAHSFNPRQVKVIRHRSDWCCQRGPDRFLQLGRCAQPTNWEKGRITIGWKCVCNNRELGERNVRGAKPVAV
jgi:hypothetical protein